MENPTEEELKNMSPEEIAELQKKNCVFCKIVKGEVPSHKVYEDDKMLALLDIYPARKGHTLVLPKEHIPIMPLLPPEVFSHVFKTIKYIVKGVKEGAVALKSTVFIANGAVAGQQSPHFLFHIIPRDGGDGLDNFNVPENDVSQDDILEPLKAKITAMMQQHKAQTEGKPVPPPGKDQLAQIIHQNPQLKEMIVKNPEQFKKALETNPQLKALFQGVDIDKLSGKLKEIPATEEEGKVVEAEVTSEEQKEEVNQEEEGKEENKEEEKAEEKEEVKEEAPKEEEKPEGSEEKEEAGEEKQEESEEKEEQGEEKEESSEEAEKEKKQSLLDKVSHLFTK